MSSWQDIPRNASTVPPSWMAVYNDRRERYENADTEALRRHFEAELEVIATTIRQMTATERDGPTPNAPSSNGAEDPGPVPGAGKSDQAPADQPPGQKRKESDRENLDSIGTPAPPEETRASSDSTSDVKSKPHAGVDAWDDEINAAAEKYDLDPLVLKAVMAKESQGDPNAVSWAGAVGLMQVKPGTASELAGRTVTAEELRTNTTLNIDLGAKYLRKMLDEKGNLPDALGAYNQGPNANWRAIPESREYVASIMRSVETGELPTWG